MPQGNIQAAVGHIYGSGKTYTHSQGLSCVFRQWRATDSHCRFLHGYALQVEVEFESPILDHRNWVQDFGGLKDLKEYLATSFDHKTLIARDDPHYSQFLELEQSGLIQVTTVDHVGCESFARMIYEWIAKYITPSVVKVTVREHEGNHAWYGRT